MPITIIFSIFVPGCETLFFTEARENEYLEYVRRFKGVYVRVVSEGMCYVEGEGNYLAATLLKVNSISFGKHLG